MNLYEHCNLCDNLKTDLQNGITCGLTDQKPVFDKTCSKIKLNEKFKEQLGMIHIEIRKLKKKKRLIYTSSFLYMILGCILIIRERNFLIEFTFTYSDYISTLRSLLIIFVGFGLCGLAYSKLSQYRKKTKIVKAEKDRIDAVLDKYQIEYSCHVDFKEKYHGNQEVVVELKSKSSLLKDSKITYQI